MDVNMFDNIVGHDYNKRIFCNILNRGIEHMSHAYMFVGNERIGKRAFSECIADNIIGVKSNKHILEPEKDVIGIDAVRQMQVDISIPPVGGYEYKRVVIIDDAHKMNISAQNALLKTLEEPPEYVCIFLIVSDVSSLLETIKSRSTLFSFEPISYECLKEVLSEISDDKSFENFCYVYLNGSYSEARELAENADKMEWCKELYEVTNELLELKIKKSDYNFVATYDYLVDNNSFYDSYFNAIMNYSMKLYNASKDEQYLRVSEIVLNAYKRIKAGANYNMTVLSMLLSIAKLHAKK